METTASLHEGAFWPLALTFGGIVIFRYLLVAGLFFLIFYVWAPARWQQRKIHTKKHSNGQYTREIAWSILTSLIFGVVAAAVFMGWQQGYFQIYTDVHQYGLLYLPLSIVVAMFIQETYYYWIHRWMHHKHVFKYVHRVHHESNITSPWTSFSFHPLESLLQAIVLPVILLVLPMHPIALLVYLTIMTLTSAINHLDVEVYPPGFENHWLGKWLIGATHHSLHHKQFRYNFGLYFTFWDKWMNTESPIFRKLFREKTSRQL